MVISIDKPLALAALAIGDRVDFRFLDFRPGIGADKLIIEGTHARDGDGIIWSLGSSANHDRDFFFKHELPWSEGASYFDVLYEALSSALSALHSAYETKSHSPLWDIKALVVSVPGVVLDAERVVQLPLWNWPVERTVMWHRDGVTKERGPFDFTEVLGAISNRIAPYRGPGARWRPHVINDTVACATAAYFSEGSLKDQQKRHNTTYLHAHNGVNLTFVGHDGDLDRRRDHAESGHLRALLHPEDEAIDFWGVCPFHGQCIEGMLAPRAWTERASPTLKTAKRIEDWHRLFFATDLPYFADPHHRDVRIMKYLTRREPDPRAIDLCGFYLAQLVYSAFLMPPAPERVFIGGRLATEEILARVRHYVRRLFHGYPARETLRDLENAIRPAFPDGQRFVELTGSLLYAYALATEPRTSAILRLHNIAQHLEGALPA